MNARAGACATARTLVAPHMLSVSPLVPVVVVDGVVVSLVVGPLVVGTSMVGCPEGLVLVPGVSPSLAPGWTLLTLTEGTCGDPAPRAGAPRPIARSPPLRTGDRQIGFRSSSLISASPTASARGG